MEDCLRLYSLKAPVLERAVFEPRLPSTQRLTLDGCRFPQNLHRLRLVIDQMPDLQQLVLTNTFAGARELRALNARCCTGLHLDGCISPRAVRIKGALREALETLSSGKLQYLSLGRWPLTSNELPTLLRYGQLRYLSLSECTQLTSEDFQNIARCFPHLATLNVRRCMRFDAAALAAWQATHPNLNIMMDKTPADRPLEHREAKENRHPAPVGSIPPAPKRSCRSEVSD